MYLLNAAADFAPDFTAKDRYDSQENLASQLPQILATKLSPPISFLRWEIVGGANSFSSMQSTMRPKSLIVWSTCCCLNGISIIGSQWGNSRLIAASSRL